MRTINTILASLFLIILFSGFYNYTGVSSFTDTRDGKTYKSIKIGDQVWMAENLKFEGKLDPWFYDNDPDNLETYGMLYDFETAGPACPDGWHLPGKAEWDTLINFLGGSKEAADKLLLGGSSGFEALLGGWYSEGRYDNIGFSSVFWSSSETDGGTATGYYIRGRNMGAIIEARSYSTKRAFYVRCIKD